MQRFEIVADALEKIDKTIIISTVVTHWDLDEHKKAIKASEEEMKRVVEMSDLAKTLIYHEYPITTVTFVQPEQPGEMHIIASSDDDRPCVSIQFSPALLGAIADNEGESFSDIDKIAREDAQRIFFKTVDYIDAKICEEREWMDYLCEVVG